MQSTVPSQSALTHPPLSVHETLTGKTMIVIGASIFVAACAHLSIPLPFTPVPITLQNFAVILVGMVLGPVAGFSAMVLYLAEGAMGLPVFTPHSVGGVAHLLGPNAGDDGPPALAGGQNSRTSNVADGARHEHRSAPLSSYSGLG